ncbi:acyltransferase family protein [Caulobacter sp.]|uniref:acyltransferase family protein n=1 Tax=Caulobacter sp. TaxID=78 RepID=UPI001B1349B9|nr:acyltransferase family protein [Caulobacter sp.]MBO9546541.1 acyltransferase [Caulobacter sp.]
MDLEYRRDIDGLRAVAVAAIVIHHAFPSLLPGGFVGVDVFFVISGYLITRLIAEARDGGSFSWGGFYLRRARRIVPAYLLAVLVTAALAAWIEMPRLLAMTGAATAASGLFLTNILFTQTAGYFAPGAQQNPLLHLWSLGVEEQFYLVWPALIALLSLKPLRGLRASLALLLLVGSLVLAQAMVASNWAFFGLPMRAWEFLAGGVLALGLVKPPQDRTTAKLAGILGGLAIAGSLIWLNEASPFPGLSAIPVCLGTALLVWSGSGAYPGLAPLRLAPVVGLGKVSYSLYLWHWPLLVLAADVAQQPLTMLQRLGLVGLALVLAILSWRFVEQPFRQGRTDRPWRRLGLMLLPLLAPIAVGALLFFTQGLPGRLSPDAKALADLEETDVNPARKACFEKRGGDDVCRFGAKSNVEGDDVLVWGDSHADAVTPGVMNWAVARGWSVREVARGGCPPLVGVSVRTMYRFKLECEAAADQVLDRITADKRLKLLVLSARWPLYRDAPPFYDVNSPRVTMEADGKRARLSGALGRTLRAIAQRRPDLRVLIVGPVPELTLGAPECLGQSAQLGLDRARCASVDAELPLSRAGPAEDAIRAAIQDRRGVTAVFPSQTLCVHGRCLSMMDGEPIYFDDDHLSASGARRLVPAWLDAGWQALEHPGS